MLFYLSSVEEGGESTFPVADNRTYEEQASVFNKPAIDKTTLLILVQHNGEENSCKDTDFTC